MTDRTYFGSMVKRSRDQSSETPRMRSWLTMVSPMSRYHWSTRAANASRPICSFVVPSTASCFSITFCVAMAAWSVPGK